MIEKPPSNVSPTVPTLLPGRSAEQLNRRLILEGSPFTSFEYVDVVFGTANTDLDIVTQLRPISPEDIDYQVVKVDSAAVIYNDQTGSRRAWKEGYVILKSSAANAKVTLLLTVRR